MILLPVGLQQEAQPCKQSVGSNYIRTVDSAGGKRSGTLLAEVNYDGQVRQEAKIGGLLYTLWCTCFQLKMESNVAIFTFVCRSWGFKCKLKVYGYTPIKRQPFFKGIQFLWLHFFVLWHKSKGSIGLGSSVRLSVRHSVRPSVRPSVDTILSPQLLQFSRDFDETFQLLFPWPEHDHVLSRSCTTDFTRVVTLSNFSLVSLVSATPLAVFSRFYWNLPVFVLMTLMTWRGSYYIEVRLDCFLPEL